MNVRACIVVSKSRKGMERTASNYLKESAYLRVSAYICNMESKPGERLPDKEECSGALRNVLDAQYALNGKWKVALILCMIQSPKRFNEILQEIPGISSKVLANELKHLELNDFIKRVVHPTAPANIIYEATAYSRGLKGLIGELSAWGAKHREKVKQSMKQKL